MNKNMDKTISINDMSFDIIVTILDKNTKEKAGQLRCCITDYEAEIFDTYMFSEYRGKGIIRHVFKKIASELKKSGILKIRLKHLDGDAHAFWKKMGFEKVDSRNNIMELDLT